MNVLLLTSAMIDTDFSSYSHEAKIKPNPSNQNFYNKLINCLAIRNNVVVVSHRPITKGMFPISKLDKKIKYDNDIPYYYTANSASKSYKIFKEVKDIIKNSDEAIDIFHSSEFIILVDTLKVGLLKAALFLSQKYRVPAYGVVTDNPKNLSHAKYRYYHAVLKNSYKLGGYLTLSDGLNKVFNKNNKPHYIFEGLVEDIKEYKKEALGDYYFFGGALYERYGVKNLIDAFHETKLPQKLVIAGSGPLRKYIFDVVEKDNRILYLSQLNKEKIYSLEQHAIANINPRPFVDKIDKESVPSKLLEYLSSGRPTISTIHSKIYDTFKADATWVENDTKEGLKNALISFSNANYDEMIKKANTARIKVFDLYGLRAQADSINYFFEKQNFFAK